MHTVNAEESGYEATMTTAIQVHMHSWLSQPTDRQANKQTNKQIITVTIGHCGQLVIIWWRHLNGKEVSSDYTAGKYQNTRSTKNQPVAMDRRHLQHTLHTLAKSTSCSEKQAQMKLVVHLVM